jgi:hypothetical protein
MNRTIYSTLAIAVVSILAIAAIAASNVSPTSAAPSSPSSPTTALPWLKTLNGQIVRADTNQRVELRGVNVLRNEWVYPDMSYERLAIPHLANVWHANLITHGFASAPVVANDATYLGVLDEYQRLAEQNNMYIIFAYYYPTLNGDQPPNPDVDPNSQQALVNLVERYRTKSNVLFMLQAEPHSDTWNGQYYRVTWNSLRPTYDQMITAMRAVDNPSPQKHLILASGDGWGRDISPVVTDGEVGHPDPITADGRENIVYSSHPYDPPSEWQYFLPVADAGYPVLITEFGTGGQMSQSDVETLMTTLNSGSRHMSWTSWIMDNEGCPCLLTGTRTNFTPSNPYGMAVRARIQAEATNFGAGDGSPTVTPPPATPTSPPPTATRTNTRTATRTRTSTPTAVATSTGTPSTPAPTSESTDTPTSEPTAPPEATNTPTTAPTETQCPMNFSDVHQGDYFYEAVRYLYCHGAISGYSDGTFRPYYDTTRGQLSKIVVLAEGWSIYTPPTPTFSDVPANHPFYQYVETAYHQGIIGGYSDGTFRPTFNVTRGQLCKIMVLAAQWSISTPPTPTFLDVPESHPFYEYVETAYAHSIVSGYADGTFRAFNSATRGQICKIVYSTVTGP